MPTGQPPQSATPAIESTTQPTQPAWSNQRGVLPKKPSKWHYLFIVLGILQISGIALFFLIIAWAIQQANAGVSGTEFIGIVVVATLLPFVGLIAFINLIGLPIYMLKHKPRGKGLVFSILSLLISIILAFYGADAVYQTRVVAPRHIEQLSRQLDQEAQEQQRQFAADNANPEITKDEAIQLLQTCQLKGFYYTDQTDKSDGGWGELSTTGVVLTKVDGKPYRISIVDRLVPELVPIARQAQQTCAGQPQFWHDGHYEQ